MIVIQNGLMWISAVAASILSVVGLGIWCDRHQVFPGRRLLGAFRRLPWPVQFFLLAFSLHLIVHGSIKTNAIGEVEGTAQQRGRDRNVASPLYEIPQSETGRVPANAELAQNWWRRGCWEDWRTVAFEDGWVFPHGSNHLSQVTVMSQGEILASVCDTLSLASLGTRVAHVPFDTCFYHEHTPSNSYRFVWNRAYIERNTNMPMTAAVELFRNGDTCVTTNGVSTVMPYEPPFPHDGIGQDDDWVRANFTNAADILSVGYANWVDAQVGVDLTNGLYKFTATFPDDPPEATELIVGDLSVCVTNAGEYVFVLEKGVEYDFGTNPYDATVEYSMQDDLMDAPVFANWWWDDDNGVWTIDGGWQWISAPTLWGFGYCFWEPKFHGSPDVAHLGVSDFPMTFEAVLTDCCRTNGVTYHWSTSTEGVRIVSPNSRVTQVEVDALPSWDRFSLTVDAYSPGETLTSTITTTYGTNATPQVSFGLSIPEVMFVNDDDDDDNGVPDCIQVTLDDDDIARGKLFFHSDVETNATIRIESLSGFSSGFYDGIEDFVFSDWACTQPIREGTEFDLSNATDWSMPLYVNPVARSTGYEDIEIVASLTFDGGERREVTAKATVVYPVVEPICNETKPVVVGGESMELTYNPCGVGLGERAYFKIRVEPEDFPDGRIVWEAEGGLTFVSGNTGREVCVLGTAQGAATLRIRLRDGDAGVPSFPVVVVPVHLIGIHAMIIRRGAFQPTDRDRIDMMIRTANDIYAQVGMRFYIASISTTNLPAAYDIVPSSVTNDIGNVWRHSQLASLRSGTGGIECYFVNRILNGKGEDSHIRGLSSKSGIALSSHAVSKTLAHEIGHLCGAEDVYDTNEYGTEPIMGHVCLEKSAEDWNGGCNGRGEAGTRYYSYGLSMRTVIGRLLMNGLSGGEDVRRDITIGSVDGYHEAMPPETTEFVITNGTAAVGFEYGGIFKLPICN